MDTQTPPQPPSELLPYAVELGVSALFGAAIVCCLILLFWMTWVIISASAGRDEDIVLPPRRRPRRNQGQWDYWETTEIKYYPVPDSTTPPSSDPKADPKTLRIVK